MIWINRVPKILLSPKALARWRTLMSHYWSSWAPNHRFLTSNTTLLRVYFILLAIKHVHPLCVNSINMHHIHVVKNFKARWKLLQLNKVTKNSIGTQVYVYTNVDGNALTAEHFFFMQSNFLCCNVIRSKLCNVRYLKDIQS